MSNKLLRAVTILITTTIGAGIYGIPYAINQAGIFLGFFFLFFLGAVVYLLHLLYGEVVLKTEGEHQLAGYGEIYLGKTGKYLAIISLLTGIYGALLAYTIKTGEFIALISNQPYPVLFSLLFFAISSIVIYLGYQVVSAFGIVLLGITIGLIGLIGLISLPHFSLSNFQLLSSSFTLLTSIFPYGVILFALTGSVAIPEMAKTLHETPQLLKKAILLGTAIPVLFYLLFSLIIIGVSGSNTSNDAISGLVNFLPSWVAKLGAGLGIITMSTAFLSLGYILRKTWQWDFGFSKPQAFLLAVFPPLVLFLIGSSNFIQVLNLAGALTGGLTGILIILLYFKVKKTDRHSFFLWLLILLLTLGMLSPFVK